jgi:hypothetical protein
MVIYEAEWSGVYGRFMRSLYGVYGRFMRSLYGV